MGYGFDHDGLLNEHDLGVIARFVSLVTWNAASTLEKIKTFKNLIRRCLETNITTSNIIFTLRAYALGPAVAGHLSIR